MHLDQAFWGSVTYVLNIFSLSTFHGPLIEDQVPLGPHQVVPFAPGPIFKPPGGAVDGRDAEFQCNYTAMKGYVPCSTPENRGCWLNNTATGHTYDINTDYESVKPTGINRFYELDITDDTIINADGVDFPNAKLFNRQYPGPWLQACWGDNVTIKINNWMKNDGGNGTSIHWHGIRQLLTSHMDGVNGVTQCPIAPGDSFTYKWEARQYGSSWFHSHYSVQYADGLLGPLTLHGPSSLEYDEPVDPILMTEWGHNSAFEAIQLGIPGFQNGKFTPPISAQPFKNPSILLNGKGNATRFNSTFTPLNETHDIPDTYTLRFQKRPGTGGKARAYLLRLINTSMASTFIFSIDNHHLQVVAADFVPVKPYQVDSILVAIGQRYHVIVYADPTKSTIPTSSYWIRTLEAGCTDYAPNGGPDYMKTGIIRYDDSTSAPQSDAWNINITCTDESWDKLKPVVNWTVEAPVNGEFGEPLVVNFTRNPEIFPLAFASLSNGESKFDPFNPLYLDYSKPTFLKLNYSGEWDPRLVVLKENYTSGSWVYFRIIGGATHPIHLHGHDFAIIKNGSSPFNLINPPRRDVILPAVTKGEDTTIAFKLDNPGNWLMHCHIAFHASFGLALQFLESQDAAIALWPSYEESPALRKAQTTCDNWNRWWGDCRNWWPGNGKSCGIGEEGFAPDSGI